MTPDEAKQVLENTDVVPCVETSLPDARVLVDACLSEGLPALVHREACSKPGCSPKFQVLVRREDAPRVAGLLQQRWMESIRREGLPATLSPLPAVPEEGDPPCPACGTAAPLAEGACSDCGLQLE
ncbi:hypothetical protein POL68_03180 [Stigmatella sp. ncwal1]|uniref:DUF2007 domain-containing protein n=1 Tax=Stigmatella ashevillensis TaxID=2995309 RepID=A0ABT5D1C4_9BACT|nr:hypothetical protein [Stigmatella ashevillena]MDC0707464.1 hypothetical protein [Stigmatella ashevillena]